MTYNVFSGTLNPAQSVIVQKSRRFRIWGSKVQITGDKKW